MFVKSMLYLQLSYTWSNDYENFIIVKAYNNLSTIKISPQLDHRSCNYELFQLIIEKYRSKATVKTLY